MPGERARFAFYAHARKREALVKRGQTESGPRATKTLLSPVRTRIDGGLMTLQIPDGSVSLIFIFRVFQTEYVSLLFFQTNAQ